MQCISRDILSLQWAGTLERWLMYEQTGRYYAFFGPHAAVTGEEKRFLDHCSAGCRRAVDFGAGLCGPASALAHLGLEVLAFEPSPILASLAMDRLNRGDEIERSITLIEGTPANFTEPFAADLILMRSVLMLLNDTERATALDAVARHGAAGARLIVDALDRRPTVDAPCTRAKRMQQLVSTGLSKPSGSGGKRRSPKNVFSCAPIRRMDFGNCWRPTGSKLNNSMAAMTSIGRTRTEMQ
jgi:hypothetical protein